jgi:hypothetical protein
VCKLAETEILITELPPDHELLKPYVTAGVMVL